MRGITIELLTKTQVGTDAFNHPLYSERPVKIKNVLVAPISDTEVLDIINLTGRRAVYQLAIPKGDTHEWENQKVRFFGKTWRIIGKPTKGIDHLIPGQWNLKADA